MPTSDDWSHIEVAVGKIARQAAEVGGEVVAVYASGNEPQNLPAGVKAVCCSGGSIFDVRAAGIEHARGALVAITEDHCLVADDFCRQTLTIHRENPEILGVAGAVLNGSMRKISDWGNFLFTFASFVPPSAALLERGMSIANGSFKRRAIDGHPQPLPAGWIEYHLNGRLLRDGLIIGDDRVVVHHIQTPGLIGTLRNHYANGRTTGALEPADQPVRKIRYLFRGCVGEMWRKRRYRRVLLASMPMIFMIAVAHVAGEHIGRRFGAGSSPFRLE